MTKCDYEKSYTNIVTGEEINFKCYEDAHESNKCKFHLEGYLTDQTREEIIQLFSKRLADAKSKNDNADEDVMLQCIGYILPTISLLDEDKEELSISIDFAYAEFKEKIDFSKILFKKEISFYNSKFHDSVSFTFSEFNEPVFFSFAKFLSTSNSFQYADFGELVDFTQATLTNVKFKEAIFSDVLFVECEFSDETSFWNVNFSKDAIFKNAKFLGTVDFSESKFDSVAEFENTRFNDYANFSKVLFEEEKTTFNGNMSNVSFLDADIKRIKFGNRISWEQVENSETKGENDKSSKRRKNTDFKIYDERLLEENDENQINLESIKNVYRDLRDNFDQNLRYDTAGEFFVREMELNRKYHDNRQSKKFIVVKKFLLLRVIFSIYWWYNILAQYGQSYYRPIYFAIPIISVGTFLLLGESMEEGAVIGKQIFYDGSLQTAFTRSLSAFIPFFTFTQTLTSTDYMLRLLLLPISITFFIALKRKMERKLRH